MIVIQDFVKIDLYEDGNISIKNIIFFGGNVKSYIFFKIIIVIF